MKSRVPALLVVCLVLAAVAASVAPRAFAYGSADQPLAQLTLSQNCVSPNICSGIPGVKGGGGLWGWIEIDTGGTGDAAGALCFHLAGLGAGAGGGRLSINWEYDSLETMPAGIVPVGTDPNDLYYVVFQFGIAFPTTPGHYSTMTAPGIQTQAQVSP